MAAFSAPVVSGYEENIFAWFAECYLRGCFAVSLRPGRKRKICIFDRRPFLGKSHRTWATKLFPGHNYGRRGRTRCPRNHAGVIGYPYRKLQRNANRSRQGLALPTRTLHKWAFLVKADEGRRIARGVQKG